MKCAYGVENCCCQVWNKGWYDYWTKYQGHSPLPQKAVPASTTEGKKRDK